MYKNLIENLLQQHAQTTPLSNIYRLFTSHKGNNYLHLLRDLLDEKTEDTFLLGALLFIHKKLEQETIPNKLLINLITQTLNQGEIKNLPQNSQALIQQFLEYTSTSPSILRKNPWLVAEIETNTHKVAPSIT